MGALGARAPPRAEKKFGGQIYRGNLYVHPRQKVHLRGRARVQFLRKLGVGEAIWGSFSVFWEQRLKKGFQLFGEGKWTPRQNSGYAYDWLWQSQYTRPSPWVIGEDNKTSSNSIAAAEVHNSGLRHLKLHCTQKANRDGVETYQCLVSVSAIYVSFPRPIFGQIVKAT